MFRITERSGISSLVGQGKFDFNKSLDITAAQHLFCGPTGSRTTGRHLMTRQFDGWTRDGFIGGELNFERIPRFSSVA
ncbi:MAG: hypothetical protein VX003_08310 [SAR324 cluster bacterium]|nr:hypothetical protein [SAR324 cluster bacterium]